MLRSRLARDIAAGQELLSCCDSALWRRTSSLRKRAEEATRGRSNQISQSPSGRVSGENLLPEPPYTLASAGLLSMWSG